MRSWEVQFLESALEDLEWFGRATARVLLRELVERLETDPLAEAKNLKTLRPNPVAERELRLRGRYRALFSVARNSRTVTVILVGEKTGNALVVRGKRYSAHEDRPAE